MATTRLFVAAVLAAVAAPLLAQEASAPAAGPAAETIAEAPDAEASSETGTVSATIALEAFKPVLDEEGQPVLDDNAEPEFAFQPVAENAALLPGDEFRYIVTLDNSGPDVEAMAIALDIPAASRLLPETVTASVDAAFELGSTSDAELREPLFVEVDGVSIPNPSWTEAPERFDQLLANIERIASGETATVTYHLVVQ